MAPEIRINNELIADLPDENGYYSTVIGEVYVNVDQIGQGNEIQELVLKGPGLSGKKGRTTENGERKIELSRKGRGIQQLNHSDVLEVKLKYNPIWVTWHCRRDVDWVSDADSDWDSRNIYKPRCYHPRWRKRHGQR